MLAEVTLCGRKAIVDAFERSEMEAPVEMIVLHSIGQAFDVYNRLIQFDLVWEDVIGDWEVILPRSAEIYAGRNPSVDFHAAVVESERRH